MECDDLIGSFVDVEDPRAVTGELRLIAAVLEVAIDEARRGEPDALAWIASDDPDGEGWSFLTVCQLLGVDPSWLRTVVSAYIETNPHVWRLRRGGAPATAVAA